MTITYQAPDRHTDLQRNQPPGDNKPSRLPLARSGRLERSGRPARRWSVAELILAAHLSSDRSTLT